MNKYQKAWMTVSAISHTSINFKCYRDEMDIQLIQQLVEKETPKKSVVIQDDIFGDYHLVCPNCGQGAIVIATRTDGKLYPRCPFCGQKLEGENEDER